MAADKGSIRLKRTPDDREVRAFAGRDPVTGEKRYVSRSVRGGKRDAQRLLTELSNELALRLARYFGTSERFWLNLQSPYELEVERDRLAGTLDQIEPLAPA